MKYLLSFVVLVVALAVPASAQTDVSIDAGAVAEAVLTTGYYVESSYQVAGLGNAMEAGGDSAPFVVALDGNIGDPSAFANDVLDLVGFGTLIVVTPDSIGGASFDYDAGDVDRIIDKFLDGLGANDDLAAAVRAASDGPGGVGAGTVLVGVGVIGGGALVVASRRRRNRLEAKVAERLEDGRSEIQRQVGLVADQIVELSTAVELAEDRRVDEFYRDASATFSAVESAVGGASSLQELESLADDLDGARWALESAQAVLAGEEPKPRPVDRPAGCFFDPTHRAGVETATVESGGKQRDVSVCVQCATELRRGGKPKPATVNVGGEKVPTSVAPRSSGGAGFDWMDVFSVIVDGARVPYSTGGRRPRRSYTSSRSGSIGLPSNPFVATPIERWLAPGRVVIAAKFNKVS